MSEPPQPIEIGARTARAKGYDRPEVWPIPGENSPPETKPMPNRELQIPLDDDAVAKIPFPISKEAFDLLMETIRLWEPSLTKPAKQEEEY